MWFHKGKKKGFASQKPTVWQQYHREVVAVAFAALFSITLLAIFSYNPHDNTLLSFSSKTQGITNLAGSFGANLAALLLYFFGSAAYTFLAMLLVPAYVLLWCGKEVRQRVRMVWLPLLVVASAGLCNVYQFDISNSYPGGLVGYFLGSLLLRTIGYGGSLVVLWALMWSGAVIVSRVSIARIIIKFSMQLLDYVQQGALLFSSYLWTLLCSLGRGVKHRISGNFKPARQVQEDGLYDDSGFARQEIPEELLHKAEQQCVQEATTGAVDVAFWNQLVDQTQEPMQEVEHKQSNNRQVKQETYSEEELALLTKREQQFAQKSINKRGIANTVFHRNIFAVSEGADQSPYMAVMKKIRALKGGKESRMKGFYQLPELSMFIPNDQKGIQGITQEASMRGRMLEEKLQHFGVKGKVTAMHPGPVITMYEYQPEITSKLSKITGLEDDLAMALSAMSIRIIAPIPGKNAVGFEIANQARQGVLFSQAVASSEFKSAHKRLPIALGVDVIGNPIIQDLASMPHLLVGGTTGSGKSVGLNSMIASLLCKRTPQDLKMILIDPKRLEFTPYADIPHLLFPIVSNPAKATGVLKWVVQEMEDRYERMAQAGVRNIDEYRSRVTDNSMPYITVIIDELADLMIVAGKEIETQIVRIAQMARAAGIHMIVATQRPSVDVVTGLIKVNFPSRVAFRVSSKVDSRTILDQQGAEKLLGRGDMLFMHSSSPHVTRIHGSYVSDAEINKLTDHLRDQQKPEYLNLQEVMRVENSATPGDEDALYPQVLAYLKDIEEISISSLQRRFAIGFNRSARMIEKLEMDGAIAPAQGSKPRKVLID